MECFNQVPFREEDRANMVETLLVARERSPLRAVYDQQVDWRDNLQTLALRPFLNDYEFQDAVVREHLVQGNVHYDYRPPRCYDWTFFAFIPLNYGAVMWEGEQVVIVEGPAGFSPELLALYENDVGVELEDYTGLMVESINGVPALDYFRQKATEDIVLSTDPGVGLNRLLNDGLYAARYLTWTLPDRAYDELVLVNKSGRKRMTVQLPWKYLWDTGDILPTSSSEEFEQLCFEPNPMLEDMESAALRGPLYPLTL